MKVVVTIPAYNEEKTIGPVIKDIKTVMDKHKYNYELIVVNDGSSDNTVEIAKKEGAVVYSHPRNLGLAETFRTEMEKCLQHKADIIVHTDADGQYVASEIPNLIRLVKEGKDLVLGSRFKGKIESMPLLKRFGNKAFSKVISHITSMRVSDGQTGFRAFTKEVAEKIKIRSFHTYTQEQIIRAVRGKFKVVEVPAYFAKRGGNTKSRLMRNPFDYAIKAWINILRTYRDYEPLKFFGGVGFLFLLAGFAIGIWLFYRFVTLGYIGRLPSTILCFLLITVGVQIILFGFFADMRKS